jgi:hypothetical protein
MRLKASNCKPALQQNAAKAVPPEKGWLQFLPLGAGAIILVMFHAGEILGKQS